MQHKKAIAFSMALAVGALLGGCAQQTAATGPAATAPMAPMMAVPPDGATGADSKDLSRHLAGLRLQRPRPDQHRHREDPQVAWTHFRTRHPRHAVDAAGRRRVLYYSGSYSRIFRARRRHGQRRSGPISPKLDDELITRQTHSPYNRGVAMGQARSMSARWTDGSIAIDQKTGKPVWDTKLIDSKKLTVGFTGAPIVVKDMVVIGAQGGEWPARGPIFGVDAQPARRNGTFLTVAHRRSRWQTWGNDSWRTGGGGGWMPGTYDAADQRVLVGHRQPGAALRLVGRRFQAQWRAPRRQPLHHLGPRARSRHRQAQILSPGVAARRLGLRQRRRRVRHDRPGGKNLVVHPNKSGYIFVYDRGDASIVNVWRITENSNFVKDIDPHTGELIGRRDFTAGPVNPPLCPAIDGGVSFNSGAYDPRTGTYFKVGNEWCIDMKVVKTRPILEPQAQLNIGADFHEVPPPGADKPWGHVDARDPITGQLKWQVKFKEPPLASLLATAGNLLFVPDAEGVLHAYDFRATARSCGRIPTASAMTAAS